MLTILFYALLFVIPLVMAITLAYAGVSLAGSLRFSVLLVPVLFSIDAWRELLPPVV